MPRIPMEVKDSHEAAIRHLDTLWRAANWQKTMCPLRDAMCTSDCYCWVGPRLAKGKNPVESTETTIVLRFLVVDWMCTYLRGEL